MNTHYSDREFVNKKTAQELDKVFGLRHRVP
jgi:hypothetical protein